jgi:hypothetical protein
MRGLLDQPGAAVTCFQLIGYLLLLESVRHLQHNFKIISVTTFLPPAYTKRKKLETTVISATAHDQS